MSSEEPAAPLPCLACLPRDQSLVTAPSWPVGALDGPLAAIDDLEGARLPDGLPPVVDAHVHLFDARLSQAIWDWFARWGWPIRYPLTALQVVDFLLGRGLHRIVALHYAHKPGIAREMNRFVAEICRQRPQVLGLATVLPGEPDTSDILREAFDLGLRGVKLHCHVQSIAVDDDHMAAVYALCQERGLPVVVHAGREPKSPGYRCDPHAICGAERTDIVLRAFPRLKLLVPHLGTDEFDAYQRLLERHEHLYLDTTMVMGGYFAQEPPLSLLQARPDRVLYGTDFPNIPYAWDRELHALRRLPLGEAGWEALMGANALRLFGG